MNPRITDKSPASVVLITHDRSSRERVIPVIDALLTDPTGPAEVVLVDNEPSEEGSELARSRGIELVSRTGGFSDGCNAGVAASSQPVVVLLGHDTMPEQGWLPPLVEVVSDPEVGAAIPVIEDAARPGTYNTSGGHLTYMGLAWVSDHGAPIQLEDSPVEVDFPCGGGMAMRRETWDRFEGFRAEYFIYQEDSDLGWRLRLGGLKTLRVPQSHVTHEYEFGRQPNKMFLLERNRLITVLSNYRPVTLFLLSPVLLATEIAIAGVAVRDGWIRQKVRSWREVWRHRSLVSQGRELSQRNRVIGDAEMLSGMKHTVTGMPEITLPPGARLVDFLLGAYKRSVAALLRLLGV